MIEKIIALKERLEKKLALIQSEGGNNEMTYQEINPTDWKYENDGDFIEGVLTQKQSDIGVNKSMLYSIETAEGIKNVWGSAILDSKMALVQVGSKIKITYKGKAEAKPGKNPAKIFSVQVDKD
jgi:hypothetical protein